ncbi:MAG: hypothetical protein ABJC13_16275 [Acidobacteriota bacterium]
MNLPTEADDVEIPFSGQLTEAEHRKIQLALLPQIFRIWPWIYLAAFVLVLLNANYQDFVSHPLKMLPGTLFLLIFPIFLFVVPRRASGKAWRSNAALRAPFSGSLSATGLAWQGPFAQGNIPWAALYGYRIRGEIALVYVGMNQAVFLLPRFFASPADWEAAQERIVANLRSR